MLALYGRGVEGDRGSARELFLTPQELVERWRGRVTLKTLENWRGLGKGPDFYRVSRGIVLYRIADVDEWERRCAYQAAGDA